MSEKLQDDQTRVDSAIGLGSQTDISELEARVRQAAAQAEEWQKNHPQKPGTLHGLPVKVVDELPNGRQCYCKSLLNGHETGCPMKGDG